MPTGIEIDPVVPPSTYQLLGKVASIALEPSIKRILINRALHITRGKGLTRLVPSPRKPLDATEVEMTQERQPVFRSSIYERRAEEMKSPRVFSAAQRKS